MANDFRFDKPFKLSIKIIFIIAIKLFYADGAKLCSCLASLTSTYNFRIIDRCYAKCKWLRDDIFL